MPAERRRGSDGAAAEPLACPVCARRFPLSERFCPDCEMPLVYVGRGDQEPVTEAHERARKIRPQFTGGELVKVAGGRNLAEAELIQNILLEEGIPSVQRRTRGFDVPDFLAAGPRDILVPAAAYETARELISGAQVTGEGAAEPGAGAAAGAGERPLALLAGILVALALAAALVFALSRLAA